MSYSPIAAPSPLQTAADAAPSAKAPSFTGWRPSIHHPPVLSLSGDNDISRPSVGGRRTSVQFAAQGTEHRRASVKPRVSAGLRRLSSPPPSPRFKPRGVSFDTFANPDANINSRSKIGIDQSLTLRDQHKDYVYTDRSRTFLCGYDTKPYSEYALEWLIDELVEDGDEVVCLRVIEKDDKLASGASIEEHRYKEVADETLLAIQEKNTENKALSLVMELTVGKVEEQIEHMIMIYEPSILIVGTKGRPLTGVQALIQSSSISKYCIQDSPIPVIVVRPSQSRLEKRDRRLKDPSRQGYRDILARSMGSDRGVASHLLDPLNRALIVPEVGEATEEEARAVAAAIGKAPPPIHVRSGLLAQSEKSRKSRIDIDALTNRSAAAQQRGLERERERSRERSLTRDDDGEDDSPLRQTVSGPGLEAIDEDQDVRVMKSPRLKGVGSLVMSVSSDEEDEGGDAILGMTGDELRRRRRERDIARMGIAKDSIELKEDGTPKTRLEMADAS